MKVTTKILIPIVSAVLIFFFINEISYYYTDLKNVKKEFYSKNKTIYNTIIDMEKNNIKSLALMLANNNDVKKAYIQNDPNILKSNNSKFWEKAINDKLIYEMHFFKPPAESFVNFSNFKSIGKDVSDARSDIVWVTSEIDSSVHTMVCKTYAGIRATFPIIDEDGNALGGLSMGKKIDWLPSSIKKVSNSDSFLVYDLAATGTLLEKYYENFLEDKKVIGKFILANKTISITEDNIKNIDFSKEIQDIKIDNKHYSLNIFKIKDFNSKGVGYLCVLNDLENFYTKFTNRIIKNIFLLFIVSFLVYILLRSKINDIINKLKELRLITRELEHERNYIHKILDLTPDITLVTNGHKLLSANQRFFEFVKFETLDDFLQKHDCICDYFVSVNGKDFAEDKKIDGDIWSIYIAKNSNEVHTAVVLKNDEFFYFNISAVYLDEEEVLVTLQDITELKKKDRLLYEQSKMASMGEMIGNIAHQWRQPLSLISTCATGMVMEKEFGRLSDEKFYESCDLINKNTQYLSKTIDDFRNFIKGDRVFIRFNFKENMKNLLPLIEGSIKAYDIDLVLDIDEDIVIEGYPNELIQCFINIFNNSKDILKDQKTKNRVFIIKTDILDGKFHIVFEDNAGGIPKDILPKIFDPYFTTKHQAQGTGLGLHMTYNLIVDGMKGKIEAKNIKLEYKGENYIGAQFTIVLPL
jgi:signal transduction histidine kinase